MCGPFAGATSLDALDDERTLVQRSHAACTPSGDRWRPQWSDLFFGQVGVGLPPQRAAGDSTLGHNSECTLECLPPLSVHRHRKQDGHVDANVPVELDSLIKVAEDD